MARWYQLFIATVPDADVIVVMFFAALSLASSAKDPLVFTKSVIPPGFQRFGRVVNSQIPPPTVLTPANEGNEFILKYNS
jgi:hypothetical protein